MPTKEASQDTRIPAVLYAAKSTEDKKGSIDTQLTDGRALAKRENWDVRGEHHDEGFSGFKGNRGPGLEAAKAEAVAIAREFGCCMLVAQHSDRIARGSGDRPDAADHLVEVVASLRRQGVTLRTVQDDHFADDTALLMAAVNGQRNTEDSARKSRAVAAGKQRQTERGERLGGPVPEGYLLHVRRDPRSDEVESRDYTFDAEREPVIRRILDLALTGMPDTAIARKINGEGLRTLKRTIKTGKRKGQTEGGVAWTRRRVQAVILNPFYSGRISGTIDGERVVVDGEHSGYITPEQQDRLIAERAKRDHNQAGHAKVGAPVRNHMLDGGELGLAGCGRCGGVMYAATSTYRRKSDGGRARTLLCGNVKFGTGLCDAPTVRLDRVEAELVAHLDGMFVDFDGWIAAQTKQRGEAGRVLRADLDRERKSAAELRDKKALLARRYTEHVGTDDTLAAADAAALEQTTARLDAAEERIADLGRLIAEADAPEPVDAALDWFNDLSASVRGALDGDNLRTVNEGLRDTFRKFWLDTTEDGDVSILPELHPDVAVRLVPSEDGQSAHLTTARVFDVDDDGQPVPVPANDDVEGVAAYLRHGANPVPVPVLVPSAHLADGQL